jgi:acyl dehydratase
MRVFATATELLSAEGVPLGSSAWHQVTQDQVDRFADATGDHQWIHVDPERAANGPFGGTVAHGYLTLSLVPMFAAQLLEVAGLAMAVNYGTEKVRFPAPVPVGSRLRDTAEIVQAVETAHGIRLTVRHTIEIEGQDKPGCVAETVALLVPGG